MFVYDSERCWKNGSMKNVNLPHISVYVPGPNGRGGFTIAQIRSGDTSCYGIAIQAPGDNLKPEKGERIAYLRALHAMDSLYDIRIRTRTIVCMPQILSLDSNSRRSREKRYLYNLAKQFANSLIAFQMD